MGLTKTSLLFYFLFVLYLHLNFISVVDSRSLRLASVDTNHVSTISKPEGVIGYGGKTPKLAVFIQKGSGGRGGGGRGGGKGRGGRGGRYDRLKQSRGGLGGFPYFYGMSHHHANRSSSSWNLGRSGCGFGWLGLLPALVVLILVS
ncbi:unnamed protein product [Arabidopsis thaliana]|uniref:Glycine-rich protein n=1 Tax=Arabidopsis thaliana TaxID=3702 RepID=A0A654G418_ARATH|nr:unnamed protein product [Arabidopsis thaliana]